jgi:hypothetical protein
VFTDETRISGGTIVVKTTNLLGVADKGVLSIMGWG